MDNYSVGSLSDLITGSTTPNKKKVIKKQIIPVEAEDSSETTVPSTKSKLKPKKQKKRKTSISSGADDDSKKGKKGKALIKDEVEPNSSKLEENTIPKKAKKRKSKSIDDVETKRTKLESNESANEQILNSSEKARGDKDKKPDDPETLARTVFVGNLPLSMTKLKLKKMFTKYGKIKSVRIRGVPVANPKTSKKVALIKKDFHPKRKSFYGFVIYYERDDAVKAVEANGTVFQDHHLSVQLCDQQKPDENKAIFVGNLSFSAEEDDLWKAFESCGDIESVRIVRDAKTGIGKGFGYVNFKSADSATLALEMENVKLKDRELRISIYNTNAPKKNVNKNKINKNKKMKPRKMKTPKTGNKETSENEVKEGKANKNKTFQGIKFMEKKKKKLDKGLLQKKRKVKQIAPK